MTTLLNQRRDSSHILLKECSEHSKTKGGNRSLFQQAVCPRLTLLSKNKRSVIQNYYRYIYIYIHFDTLVEFGKKSWANVLCITIRTDTFNLDICIN